MANRNDDVGKAASLWLCACGRQNKTSTRRCVKCGQSLAANAEFMSLSHYTGRTSRMVAHAIRTACEKPVVIMAADAQHREFLQLQVALRKRPANSTYAIHVAIWSPSGGYPAVGWFDYVVLYDHHTLEPMLTWMTREAHRFDSPDE